MFQIDINQFQIVPDVSKTLKIHKTTWKTEPKTFFRFSEISKIEIFSAIFMYKMSEREKINISKVELIYLKELGLQ